MELVDNTMITMENSHSSNAVHTAPTDARRGGPSNIENSKIFCWFFPSGFFSSDRRQYSWPMLWDLGLTSLIMIRVPLTEPRRTPSGYLWYCTADFDASTRYSSLNDAIFMLHYYYKKLKKNMTKIPYSRNILNENEQGEQELTTPGLQILTNIHRAE